MNEDIILSAYIDGELPSDVAALVKARLERDPSFRARHDALAGLRQRLAASDPLPDGQIEALRIRGWQRLQRNLSPRPGRLPSWLYSLAETFSFRISVPVPALMAGIVVVGAVVAFSFSHAVGSPADNVATVEALSPTPLQLPTTGQSGAWLNPARFGGNAAQPSGFPPATADQSESMAITVEVQNLRQLLSVLENSQGVREVTIQLPRSQQLEPLGEPALLSAQELETVKLK